MRKPDGKISEKNRPWFSRVWAQVYLFEWLSLISLSALVLFFVSQPVRSQPILLAALLFRRITILALISIVAAIAFRFPTLIRGHWRDSLHASDFGHFQYWGDTLRIMVAFSIIQTSHLLLKAYIPLINPVNHDAALKKIDLGLLFGHDPTLAVLHLLSSPLLHHAFDVLYSGVYFFALWAGVVVFLGFLSDRERIAFFNSFFIMWQLGLLLYILLPSWGPVFVQPGPFEGTLGDMPLTVMVQHSLFLETSSLVRGHYDVTIRFFGLAAFPSLHVAVFVLYTLWAKKIGRIWTIWNLSLVPLMLIGSMLTGYHYLIDGLVGALVAAFSWVIGRRCMAKQ